MRNDDSEEHLLLYCMVHVTELAPPVAWTRG